MSGRYAMIGAEAPESNGSSRDASGRQVPPLLREWIEQQVADGADADEVISVADLKRLIARRSHSRRAG